MKLEQQVVSLELAKKLKELGVKQDSLYVWSQCCNDPEWNIEAIAWHNNSTGEWDDGHILDESKIFSAFTVAELGEMFPDFWTIMWQGDKVPPHSLIVITNEENGKRYQERADDTEADARAKMLIYLLENKMIDL